MLRQAQLHIYAFPMCIYCQVQSAVLHWQWTCSSCPQLTAPAILPDAQHAMGVMELARKMDPGLGECFMLFVRDREQKQRQGAGGCDDSYDLLSYVEFQVSLQMVVAAAVLGGGVVGLFDRKSGGW